MPITIILYARTFIILTDRVDSYVRKQRFVYLTNFVKYIIDSGSLRASYALNDVEIINKIPYRNLAVRYESAITTALQI